MANGRDTREIKRIRNEILVVLKVLYPAALQADQLFRSLLVLFPTLEFDSFKRDVHYLREKGYLQQVNTNGELDTNLTAWKRRWLRLTPSGMELADRCIHDPALEE